MTDNAARACQSPDRADTPPVFRGKYLSIISYKADGTAVATPVWFVQQDGRLLVETDAAAGKVKRIRRNPVVQVASCTACGLLRGEPVAAVAEVLPEPEAIGTERLIADKYRADILIVRPLQFVHSALHLGRPRTRPVILAITPS